MCILRAAMSTKHKKAKRVVVVLDEAQHQHFKIKAAQRGESMQDVLVQLLTREGLIAGG